MAAMTSRLPVACLLTALLLLPLLLLSARSLALEADLAAPLHIQAEAARVNEQTGVSSYEGRVLITQGTLKVTAGQVELRTEAQKLVEVIASGGMDGGPLAQYEQQASAAGEGVAAEARTITYLVNEERVRLAGDARLVQAGDVFTGDLIHYDIARGQVRLGSSKQAGGRVKLQMAPKPQPKDAR